MNFNIYKLFLNNSLPSQTFEEPYSHFSLFNTIWPNPVLKINANKPPSQTMENPFLTSWILSQNQPPENLEIREPLKTHSKITAKVRQKAPYNFGKTAIGTYMMRLIHKGAYDDFLMKTLNRDQTFIKAFKQFCLKLDYKTLKDFRNVWKYTDFVDSGEDPSHNFYVALKKITELFLKKDVTSWIEKKTKSQEYRPLYAECAEIYRKGIENIENFDFSKFC